MAKSRRQIERLRERKARSRELARASESERATAIRLAQLDIERARRERTRLIAFCRVSQETQERNGNLCDAEDEIIEVLRGCNVLEYHSVQANSRLDGHDRYKIQEVIEAARKLDASIVTMSRDRYFRAYRDINERRVDAPTETDYAIFAKELGGVKALTILPPSQSGRSQQIKRGQNAKGKRGGRPRKTIPGINRLRLDLYKGVAGKLWRRGSSFRSMEELLEELASRENFDINAPDYRTLCGWAQRGLLDD